MIGERLSRYRFRVSSIRRTRRFARCAEPMRRPEWYDDRQRAKFGKPDCAKPRILPVHRRKQEKKTGHSRSLRIIGPIGHAPAIAPDRGLNDDDRLLMSQSSSNERFERAMAAIDAANAEDPERALDEDGQPQPAGLLYARRLSDWLNRLAPDAPEALRLAARAQHIRRWHIPRSAYPMDRAGYHRWRSRLYDFHAEQAGQVLQDAGYDDATIARVQSLLRKEKLDCDPDTQTLEDAVCLVFLEREFAEFARGRDESKLLTILQRTWKKMSEQGQRAALALELPAETRRLIEKAIG
jgi:hypothetical protein